MRLVIRLLTAATIVGCFFWIRSEPGQIEPIVTGIASLTALLATFQSSESKRANVLLRIVVKTSVLNRLGKAPISNKSYFLEIENKGDAEAKDFQAKVILLQNQRSPFFDTDLKNGVLKYPEIYPGQIHPTLLPLSMDSGTEFEFEWQWREGWRIQKRRGLIQAVE